MMALGLGPEDDVLPYEDFRTEYKEAILCAVQAAWADMLADNTKDYAGMIETDVTKELVRRLNFMLAHETDPDKLFSAKYFQDVVRGAEVESFDGTHSEKRPDLTFRLVQRLRVLWPEYRALFVECKLVRSPDKTLKYYGDDGIRRFVDGEYAWAMPSAMMIGYVHDGTSNGADLQAYLRRVAPKFETTAMPVTTGPRATETRHGRQKVTCLPATRGEISVTHLWLAV